MNKYNTISCSKETYLALLNKKAEFSSKYEEVFSFELVLRVLLGLATDKQEDVANGKGDNFSV